MINRTSHTLLAISAALALTASAIAPTAALAKGPGGGSACDGDCAADQIQAQQQIQARDGSGGNQAVQTRTKSTTKRAQARAGTGGATRTTTTNVRRGKNAAQNQARKANANARGQNPKGAASRGSNVDRERGPGSCEECDAQMGVLTEEQAAGLVFMANEEKLAHDVYATLAEQHGVRMFANIAASEAMHQDAINAVLVRYGLDDPAIELPVGEFSDPAIATLWDTLVEQGSASLEEAIAAGVIIESTDIADLEARLAGLEETAPDVYEMYSHLLAASQNHLAAFEAWL